MRVNQLLAGIIMVSLGTAGAWWDTRIIITRPGKLVKEVAAAEMKPEPPAQRIEDKEADGGKGGKVIELQSGKGSLNGVVELGPGLYSAEWIARMTEKVPAANTGVFCTVKNVQTGKEYSFRAVARVGKIFSAFSAFAFPVYQPGKFEISLRFVDDKAVADGLSVPFELPWLKKPTVRTMDADEIELLKNKPPWGVTRLLVDRLEIRSFLPATALAQLKSARNLPKELALDLMAPPGKQGPDGDKRKPVVPNPELTNDRLWAAVPEWNTTVGTWESLLQPNNRKSQIAVLASEYLLSGNEEAARQGAVLLVAAAEKWPSLDHRYYGVSNQGFASNTKRTHYDTATGQDIGKHVYRGWSGGPASMLLASYDSLYPYIKGNKELAKYVGTKIPGIKTPEDVIRFLDERVIASTVDQVRRGPISADDVPVVAAIVLGPGKDSDEFLRATVYSKIHDMMLHAGGIQDHAVSTFSIEGLPMEGSIGYAGAGISHLVKDLALYEKMAGKARFTAPDSPMMLRAKLSEEAGPLLRTSSGFMPLRGDYGNVDSPRAVDFADRPSRVIGGSGYTFLESGAETGNPDLTRTALIAWGSGIGHAHADTLNLEVFAHGCRMTPDLGGRHEGKLHGSPNMRTARVHNLVEVDGQDFINRASSITPGTGWLVAYAPGPGVQFAEHQARAESHPQVKYYARQSALVDLPNSNATGDSYVFDVFRVAGGNTHSYNFHGAQTDAFRTNAKLADATSETAQELLRKHVEGTRKEGPMPQMLEADWPIQERLIQRFTGGDLGGKKPVTRLSMPGIPDAQVLVGDASSEAYKFRFPFLHVLRKGKDLESVFVGFIEPYGTEPFLKSKKLLGVRPAAEDAKRAVAAQVETTAGTTDLLYASGNPDAESLIEGNAKAAARFAFVSTGKNGLEKAEIVDGTKLEHPAVSISPALPAIEAKIVAVDYPARKLTLDKPLPPSAMAAQTIIVSNGNLPVAFTIEKIEGNSVTLRQFPGVYQARVEQIEGGRIFGEFEPIFARYQKDLAPNCVLANEDGSKTWRVKSFAVGDHFMHIGFPGYRGSFPNKISLDALPDKNSDGKRMLKFIDVREQPGSYADALVEVTRIWDDGETFDFRFSGEHPREVAWATEGYLLENEDGTTRWYSRYAGTTQGFEVDGTLAEADFSDADGDGEKKFLVYFFGVGDSVRVTSFVSVARDPEKPAAWNVVASTPFEITLPAAKAKTASVTLPDGTKTALEVAAGGQTSRLGVTPAALGAGKARIELAP